MDPSIAPDASASSVAAPAASSSHRSRDRSPQPRDNSHKHSRSRSRSHDRRRERKSRSRSRSRSRRRSPKRKHRRRRSRSSSSDSSSSSESSDSSSSDDSDSSEDSSRKKKKHKKPHKHKSSKSKKDKKDRKQKKSKREKKSKKKKKEKAEPSSALAQQSWGAHGVLTSTDIYTKSAEFYTWCMEVKNISRENMSKRDEKELFSEFAEDYNTSTLKHPKYYDLEKWERERIAKGEKLDDLAGKTDEERMRIENQRARSSAAAAHENARIQTMKLLMQKERESKSEAWQEIEKRQLQSMQKSTFESIAKQREQDKKDAEALAKQKFR